MLIYYFMGDGVNSLVFATADAAAAANSAVPFSRLPRLLILCVLLFLSFESVL